MPIQFTECAATFHRTLYTHMQPLLKQDPALPHDNPLILPLILLYTTPTLASHYTTCASWISELTVNARLAGHAFRLEWRQEEFINLPFFIRRLVPAGCRPTHLWRPQPMLTPAAPPLQPV